MRTDLVMHILSGAVGLACGFVALYAAKGAAVHRKSGMGFVYGMLAMSLLGVGISAVRGVSPQSNIPAGLLTAYLVVTGLTTVSPPAGWTRRLDIAMLLVVATVGAVNVSFAASVLFGANAKIRWIAIPFTIFASIAALAAVGDLQVIRSGARTGATRLARHLWRMCFALFVGAFSFVVQAPKFLPARYGTSKLLMVPVLAVLVTMLYWLWRVGRKRRRGAAADPLRRLTVREAHGSVV